MEGVERWGFGLGGFLRLDDGGQVCWLGKMGVYTVQSRSRPHRWIPLMGLEECNLFGTQCYMVKLGFGS